MKSVYSAVRAGSLNKAVLRFVFKGLTKALALIPSPVAHVRRKFSAFCKLLISFQIASHVIYLTHCYITILTSSHLRRDFTVYYYVRVCDQNFARISHFSLKMRGRGNAVLVPSFRAWE
jgi:hypothetical protein